MILDSVSAPLTRSLVPQTTEPTIMYSLFYDVLRGCLTVYLKQVYNLKLKAKAKTLDSYVVVFLLPHQHEVLESQIVKDSLNPSFNRDFEFSGQPDMQIMNKQTLVFRIFAYYK